VKDTMKAVGLYEYLPIDHPKSLVDIEIDRPVPSGRDILVKVKAVSVNPVDTKVRQPKEKIETEPRILGWDVAGIIEEMGPECTLFQPGDEVFYAGSIIRQGGNSEFHLVDERIAGKKPASLDFAEAAALPLTSITAWEALFDRLVIELNNSNNQKKSILIIGAAGGVGSIASQLAKLAGLTVIGTASRNESIKWAEEHGCDFVINHYNSFIPQLEQIGFEHVDYILCLHTTEKHWKNMAEAIAPQGKICSIVEADEPLDLTLLKDKSITFVWEFMFTRSKYQTEDMDEQNRLLNQLSQLIDQQVIYSTIAEVLSPINAENLQNAHAKLESGTTIGKLVIKDF
jgi:NADPH2:quinone reductase